MLSYKFLLRVRTSVPGTNSLFRGHEIRRDNSFWLCYLYPHQAIATGIALNELMLDSMLTVKSQNLLHVGYALVALVGVLLLDASSL